MMDQRGRARGITARSHAQTGCAIRSWPCVPTMRARVNSPTFKVFEAFSGGSSYDNLIIALTFAGPQAGTLPARYDRDVLYTINISNAGFPTDAEVQLRFRFGQDGANTGGEVTGLPDGGGPLVGPVEQTLSRNGILVRAGLYDDPFFFDLEGFKASRSTGTLEIGKIAKVLELGQADKTVLVFGLVFLVSGLAFKLGAVPFHMWVPDVYHGAPTAVTLLIGGAPKLAAFAIVIRLLVEGMLPLALDWQSMLMILSVGSLLIGNLAAIAQTNLKRMLAYSAIAQMGFVLLGMLSVFDDHAFSASMFYAITYVLTTLGTFGLLMVLSRKGYDCETLDGLKGLNKKHPWFAFIGLIMMFSLAGIPPTVGFAAKLGVLEALVDAEHTFLAVIAVIASLIGAFYYLRVVKVMYFDEPEHEISVSGSGFAKGILGLNGILVLAIGIVPASLMSVCLDAMRRTLLGS